MGRNHMASKTEHPQFFLTVWDVSLRIGFATHGAK